MKRGKKLRKPTHRRNLHTRTNASEIPQKDFEITNQTSDVNKDALNKYHKQTLYKIIFYTIGMISGVVLIIYGFKDEYFNLEFGDLHIKTQYIGVALILYCIFGFRHVEGNIKITKTPKK